MGRPVVIGFYDPQAAGLAVSALRGRFINADGAANGAVVSTGFASVNGTPDQFVWAGELPGNFAGLMQFSTSTGRVLGVSDMPAAQYGEIQTFGTDDVAGAVWAWRGEQYNNATLELLENGYGAARDAAQSADAAARPGAAMTLTPAERNATADALLDRVDGVETGLTLRQHLRIAAAVLFGKATVSGNQVQFKRRDGTTTAVSVDFSDTGARPNSQIGSV